MDPCIQDRPVGILQEQIKVVNNRISDLEKNHEILFEMNKNIGILAEQVSQIVTEQKITRADVEAIKCAPGQDMAKIKLGVVMTVIGLIIGMFWDKVM